MPTRPSNEPRPPLAICDHCPGKNKPELAYHQKRYSIPEKQVIWWHCSICQGWHVRLNDIEDNQEDGTV